MVGLVRERATTGNAKESHAMFGAHCSLRPTDVEALRRLRDRGPLTIPQAYDCGHNAHGMNRLVGAEYAFFSGWDPALDDALWNITKRGRSALAGVQS